LRMALNAGAAINPTIRLCAIIITCRYRRENQAELGTIFFTRLVLSPGLQRQHKAAN
jgi:hypothetical protein